VWFFHLAVLFRFYHVLVVFLSEQIKMMKMNHSDRKYERMDVHCIYAKNSLSVFRKSKV